MQDTTNFTKLAVADDITAGGDIEAVGAVKGASGEFTSVVIAEVNGRNESVVVIASLEAAVALSAAQKKARVVEVTAAHSTNVLTLGLAAGQFMIVQNNDADTALIVKNIAGDTGLSIPATKAALVAAGTGAAMISLIDTTS